MRLQHQPLERDGRTGVHCRAAFERAPAGCRRPDPLRRRMLTVPSEQWPGSFVPAAERKLAPVVDLFDRRRREPVGAAAQRRTDLRELQKASEANVVHMVLWSHGRYGAKKREIEDDKLSRATLCHGDEFLDRGARP